MKETTFPEGERASQAPRSNMSGDRHLARAPTAPGWVATALAPGESRPIIPPPDAGPDVLRFKAARGRVGGQNRTSLKALTLLAFCKSDSPILRFSYYMYLFPMLQIAFDVPRFPLEYKLIWTVCHVAVGRRQQLLVRSLRPRSLSRHP